MNRLTTSAALAAMALSAAAPAWAASDASFLKTAIKGDLSEIELGRLAEQRAQSPGVRDFGRTLVADHSMARDKASALARQMGVTPPAQPMNKAQREYRRLQGMRGRAFDREFVRYMVNDHKQDIRDFSEEAREHGPVARLARQTLPDLHKHLDIATRLSGRV